MLDGQPILLPNRRLTLSCDKGSATIPWLVANLGIERAFEGNRIDHLTVFKKEHDLKTSNGIGVQLTANYYMKSDKSAEPIAEGTDYYEAVEVGDTVEIQWTLKVSF